MLHQSSSSHSAPFFAVLKQFCQSLRKRREDKRDPDYFICSNLLFPWHFSFNHNFLQTGRPISDPLG